MSELFPSLLISAEDERRKLFALLPTRHDNTTTMKGHLKNQVTKLLNEILAILKRDGKTVADLASDMDRNYNQVYDWVVRRQFNPQASGLLLLQGWRDKHISPCAAKRRPRRIITAQRS
jgi:hypothetical protein